MCMQRFIKTRESKLNILSRAFVVPGVSRPTTTFLCRSSSARLFHAARTSRAPFLPFCHLEDVCSFALAEWSVWVW